MTTIPNSVCAVAAWWPRARTDAERVAILRRARAMAYRNEPRATFASWSDAVCRWAKHAREQKNGGAS